MIRRWSCVIDLLNDFSSPFYIKKRFKFRVFRLNVRFKRFNLKKTKFKRKALARMKHKTQWYIYFASFKTWIKDFKCLKKYVKYQYVNRMFSQSSVVFDPNFFKNRSDHYLYNFDGKLSNITKKFYLYLHKSCPIFFKNSNLTFSWSPDEYDSESNVVQLVSHYDGSFYPPKPLLKSDYSIVIDNFIFALNVSSFIELKKILNFIYLYAHFKR